MSDPFMWIFPATAIFLWVYCVYLTKQLNRAERGEAAWRSLCYRWERVYNELKRRYDKRVWNSPKPPPHMRKDPADWWKDEQ